MATSKTSPTAGETKSDAEGNVPSGDVEQVIAVNGVEPDTSVATVQDASPEEAPKMADISGIRYVGMADVKTLTQLDLLAMGADDAKGDLVWSSENGKIVPTKEFNAATRDVLLALPDFVVA